MGGKCPRGCQKEGETERKAISRGAYTPVRWPLSGSSPCPWHRAPAARHAASGPREFLPSLSPHLPLLSVPRFPAQGAKPPGWGQRCVCRLRGGAPWQAVGSPVRRPHRQGLSAMAGGVPGAAVWRRQRLPGAGNQREDLPGVLLSPGEAVPVPPASGEKSPLQEGVCHMYVGHGPRVGRGQFWIFFLGPSQ